MSASETVGLWGPRPARKPGSLVWYVVLGVVLAVVLPAVPLTFAVVWEILRQGATGSAQLPDVEKLLTGSGPLLVLSLALTWAGFAVAVGLAGRRHEGGWRALVGWGVSWRTDVLFAAGFTGAAVGFQVAVAAGLSLLGVDASELGNTGMLSAVQGGWLVALVAAAVVGAPLFEELFFRGLFFNVARGRFGVVGGAAVSGVGFGLMHAQSALAAAVYTVSMTGLLGFGLALLYARTGRLGTCILAHGLFNAVGVGLALSGWGG